MAVCWCNSLCVGVYVVCPAFGLASVKETLSIHPHVILFLLLPPLIFESAANLVSVPRLLLFAVWSRLISSHLSSSIRSWLLQDVHAVSKVIHQALLMALPGVFIATGLTAAMLKVMFWSYNWTWSGALLAGCILSATDPVAVVAVLKVWSLLTSLDLS